MSIFQKKSLSVYVGPTQKHWTHPPKNQRDNSLGGPAKRGPRTRRTSSKERSPFCTMMLELWDSGSRVLGNHQ